MLFSSISFVFYFLPITVIGYYLLKERYRNFFLWILSLFFYAWGEPVYVLLLLISAIVDYCAGLYMERNVTMRKWGLIVSIVINLSFLCFFKYLPFIQELLGYAHLQLPFHEVALPLGISFYTFQTMSYSIDVYMKKIKPTHSFIDFAMYVSLFPQLIAGPIVRYCDIAKQIRHRKHSFSQCEAGITRFVYGLSKKLLIANAMGSMYETMLASPLSMLGAWLAIIAFALQIYYDFSGYSDMAIGLGMMFGFNFPENFNYPYMAISIQDFWRRWHITLSTWFREYLYIPLGGNHKHKLRNLILVWALCGLWHGASLNFLLWGLYYGGLLLLEKYVCKNILTLLPKVLRHVITLCFILFGWVIFAFEDIGIMLSFMQSLLFNPVIVNDIAFYQGSSNLILLIIAILCSFPVIPSLKRHITISKWARQVMICFLFLLCSAYLCDATYNPFLYFRF